MAKSFVAEFDECFDRFGDQVGDQILEWYRTDPEVPRDTGELARGIVGSYRTGNGIWEGRYESTTDHGEILDSGISKRPITPVTKGALAGDGFGPVASADPARTLNKYKGWWKRVTSSANTDPIITRALQNAGVV